MYAVLTVEVHDFAVWALKYEEEDGLCAETCQLELMLQKLDNVTQVLQSRFLVNI